ncbi:MAG: hypothetical protein GWM98_07270, partial [Nitrospinaceae bacterium]|nr:hypothetical protein [Nitrospinaceae bacterium]NIR54336.1 hypothetical protein [Nitrospinaceae bacterium]NIS84754.1 hypothetical protein [Nitrospinaceae bacterium]NIT81555.1 hypothetical protein [Nitrospinaceae bacterium]NIU43840.1 hypothetical protein [Nitrospinaceae bacterium]
MTVYLNGRYLPLEEARVSILDRGFNYGDAVFETLRAYGGVIFRLDLHLERFQRGAEGIFLNLPETPERLKDIVYETLRRNSCPDAMIRMTLTRGEGVPGKMWASGLSPTLAVHVRPHQPPPEEWYRKGVQISLIPDAAVKFAGLSQQVKSANYLNQILARKTAEDHRSAEAVLLNPGKEVCDGTVSNIFAVRGGELWTPEINAYVLAGITRQTVLDLARDLSIPCHEKTFPAEDLFQADEIFLTNTGWELLPVTRVDEQIVGTGKPGPVTQTLHGEFLKSVDAIRG